MLISKKYKIMGIFRLKRKTYTEELERLTPKNWFDKLWNYGGGKYVDEINQLVDKYNNGMSELKDLQAKYINSYNQDTNIRIKELDELREKLKNLNGGNLSKEEVDKETAKLFKEIESIGKNSKNVGRETNLLGKKSEELQRKVEEYLDKLNDLRKKHADRTINVKTGLVAGGLVTGIGSYLAYNALKNKNKNDN